jgi:hypothetical protein
MKTSIARFIVLGAALASAASVAAEELARRDILYGAVSLLLPTSFELMSEERLRAKYPSAYGPQFVFTDPTGSINVAIGHLTLQITPEEIVEAHRGIEQSVRSQVPTAVWQQSEAVLNDGQPHLLLAYQSPGIDVDVQNIQYITSLDGRLLTIAFNCPVKSADQWLQSGRDIIGSIVVAKPAAVSVAEARSVVVSE